MKNAARVTGRELRDLRVVVSGAGASGVAVSKILLEAGVGDIGLADRKGMIHAGRADLTPIKASMAAITNSSGYTGTIEAAMIGADVFIGLSAGKVAEEDVAKLAPNAMIFAMANPDPEIHPDVARRYARVVATGRSDFPNQINNVLAFPGVFRGALDVRASAITENMKLAAASALCDVVGADVSEDYVIPSVFDPRVGPAVAAAVAQAARDDGVARR
jgi:malate dehydrogenase (oxaloacetate-decarboxylating)